MNLEVETDSQTLLPNLSKLSKPKVFHKDQTVHSININKPVHQGGWCKCAGCQGEQSSGNAYVPTVCHRGQSIFTSTVSSHLTVWSVRQNCDIHTDICSIAAETSTFQRLYVICPCSHNYLNCRKRWSTQRNLRGAWRGHGEAGGLPGQRTQVPLLTAWKLGQVQE